MAATADRPRQGWLLRAVFAIVAAVYLVAAWGSAFDRVAASQPSAQALVPGPFRAKADAVLAFELLRQGQPDAARIIAARAVDEEPIDRNPTAILGAALLASGRTQEADAAFRVAARFGWRQSLTQLYWLEVGLRSGDMDMAALRLDAMLRADPEDARGSQLLDKFEAEPAGRLAIARRLADDPPWRSQYLQPAPGMAPSALDGRARTFIALAGSGTRLGCEPVKVFVEQAIERATFELAEQVWDAHCLVSTRKGGLRDGQFARVRGAGRPDPLGWRSENPADIILRPRSTGGTGGLRLENTAPAARSALSQPVRLPPGAIIASWDADRDRVDVSLDCATPARPGFGADGERTLRVPDCPVQYLRIWVASGSGPVTLREIAVRPGGGS